MWSTEFRQGSRDYLMGKRTDSLTNDVETIEYPHAKIKLNPVYKINSKWINN